MWVPAVAAWTLAWNRWCLRPWRSIDVSAVVLAVAGIIGAVIHSASVTQRQPARVDRAVCRDRRAHCPQRTNADPGARHVGLDCGRAIRRRAARSDRRAGHLVSVRHRRVADAVRLRDRHPAPGLIDRANLAFKENASISDAAMLRELISRYRCASDHDGH